MSPDEISNICEKAAGIIREKGKHNGDLWNNKDGFTLGRPYVSGPVCAIGALSIAAETHQDETLNYEDYGTVVDSRILNAVAKQSPVKGTSSVGRIYSYSDTSDTDTEDIAQMFERAAKAVTSE